MKRPYKSHVPTLEEAERFLNVTSVYSCMSLRQIMEGFETHKQYVKGDRSTKVMVEGAKALKAFLEFRQMCNTVVQCNKSKI